jgi:hypothetical protein
MKAAKVSHQETEDAYEDTLMDSLCKLYVFEEYGYIIRKSKKLDNYRDNVARALMISGAAEPCYSNQRLRFFEAVGRGRRRA